MNCPYCEKEMREGGIPARQEAVKWLSGERKDEGWEAERERVLLSEVPYVTEKEARAFYCPDCRVVIVPVPEVKTASDKLKRKWDAFAQKLEAVHEEKEAQWTEAKKKREKKKRTGKDPWEL